MRERQQEARSLVAAGWSVAFVSDQGTVRQRNEDRCQIVNLGSSVGVLVADGMGGIAGGAEAAQTAVDVAIAEWSGRGIAVPLQDIVDRTVAALARQEHHFPGLGCTMLIGILDSAGVTLAHVGDGRAYRVSGGGATRLTEDHSQVADLLRAGRIDAADVRGHPLRNRLTRAVTAMPVTADLVHADIGRGETLVLCSDGVWEPLLDPVLASAASLPASVDVAARQVCDTALAAGSRDNVSVLVARRAAP